MTETKAQARIQILLAEDDEVSQRIVEAFLRDSNVQLTIASDGREALEIALTRKFDLMIVDQNMPFVTGDRVIRHIRAGRTLNSATPVIRFTAAAENKPLDLSAIANSMDVMLPKPISKAALTAAIGAMLGR